MVANIIPPIVSQEIILKTRELVYSPMMDLLLIIFMTKIKIIGNKIPFTPCENTINLINGIVGSKTSKAGITMDIIIIV